ncbi:hypothetical protein C1645_836272 [Glomus cerebriforme]|uniref:F-box domain-containing protein n=1 Tax=Glomus cerebriforme TaxID=658196 RepID=A0A397S8P9_9GLOM|nr:hypothetical protein C1645_836272 [Glomus cerebriforme]
MTISKLNEDILYLIFKPLQGHNATLHSYLLVNKTWCKIIIPILWRDPWSDLKDEKKELLLNVIISHLSEEPIKNLDIKIQRPLFNYITFCKHLNFGAIENIIDELDEKSKIPIIKNEIFNLFINEDTKFTHLYIPCQFDYQIHIIPGAKHCFSDLESISCSTNINDNILDGLIEICKPIKELKLFIERSNNNSGIAKLIKAIKRLSGFHLLTKIYRRYIDVPFSKIVENSLIQHAETIQYFTIIQQPVTKILESFVNLKRLEFKFPGIKIIKLDNLKDVFLPFLQILKIRSASIRDLINLIKNTNGYLTVIKINSNYNEINDKLIIQAIYNNCPKLKELRLRVNYNNILDLEQLLINCQYLNKLHIYDCNFFDWNNAFEILTKLSPTGLYRFKLSGIFSPSFESLNYFLIIGKVEIL